MQLWPPHHSAALIARASALVAKLCLKLKRLFQPANQSPVAQNLPPMEYKSAAPKAVKPKSDKEKSKKTKAEKVTTSDPAQPKRKHAKKGPCPHCGRPYGKQPVNHAEQCLREQRALKRMEREKATIRKQAEMAIEGQEATLKEKAPKEPKVQQDPAERPKPYNVRCPHCKRLIKQPYDVVGNEAYHTARKPISDAIWQEFNQPTGELKTLLEARWRVDTWLLTLAVPHLKEADAALRAKPSFSNGQPIEIMVPWNSPPPHFVPPDEEDERACIELKDYKKKERRLRAEAKRRAAGQRPRNYDNVYEKNYRIVRNGKFDTGYTKIYDKHAKSEPDSGYPDSYSKPKKADTGYPDSYSKQKKRRVV